MQIVHEDPDIISDPKLVEAELFHYVNGDIDNDGNSMLHLIAQAMSEDTNASIHKHHGTIPIITWSRPKYSK